MCTPCTRYNWAGVQALTCARVRFARPQPEVFTVTIWPAKACAVTLADSQLGVSAQMWIIIVQLFFSKYFGPDPNSIKAMKTTYGFQRALGEGT